MPNASVDRGVLIIYFWDRLTDFLFYIFLSIPDPPASQIAALVLHCKEVFAGAKEGGVGNHVSGFVLTKWSRPSLYPSDTQNGEASG